MKTDTPERTKQDSPRLSGAELEAWYANNPPVPRPAAMPPSTQVVNWVFRWLDYRGTWQLVALAIAGWVVRYDLWFNTDDGLLYPWGVLLGFYLVAGAGPCWGRSLIVLGGGILLTVSPFDVSIRYRATLEPLYVAELIGISSLSTLAAVAILQGLTNWGRFRIRFSLATIAQVTAAACVAMALLQPFLEFARWDQIDNFQFLVLIPCMAVITPVVLLPLLLKTDAPRYRIWGLCLPVALMVLPTALGVFSGDSWILAILAGSGVTLVIQLKTWLLVGLLHFGLGLFGWRLISAGNVDAEGAQAAEVAR